MRWRSFMNWRTCCQHWSTLSKLPLLALTVAVGTAEGDSVSGISAPQSSHTSHYWLFTIRYFCCSWIFDVVIVLRVWPVQTRTAADSGMGSEWPLRKPALSVFPWSWPSQNQCGIELTNNRTLRHCQNSKVHDILSKHALNLIIVILCRFSQCDQIGYLL